MPISPMHTTAMATDANTGARYQISQAAALSGITTANIRFYEKEKLLSPQGRGDNSYRMYSDADVHQLLGFKAKCNTRFTE